MEIIGNDDCLFVLKSLFQDTVIDQDGWVWGVLVRLEWERTSDDERLHRCCVCCKGGV